MSRVDLFGDPVRERREGRGRPEHEWSQENSNKINLMFAVGYELKDAAKAIGVSVPTLRKHYFSEVEQWKVARLRLEAKLLTQLHDEGTKGNVAAIKEIFKRADKGRLEGLAAKVADRGKHDGSPKPVGKKESAAVAAHAVTGRFAPPPAPKLLN